MERVVFFDRSKCIGYVNDIGYSSLLDKRWIGRSEGSRHVLSLEEIAYLLLRKECRVATEHGEIHSLDELMESYSECFERMFWPKLVVYNDLRSRGRRARVIDGEKFLVKHKDNSIKLVLVLEEKKKVSVADIFRQAEQARRNNLELVLGIVSLQGDITYYTVSPINLVK